MAHKYFVDKHQLYDDLKAYYRTGDPEAFERLGESAMKVARNILGMPSFRYYDTSTKDEMVGTAVYKITESIHRRNFDLKRSREVFSYWTQTAFYAFISVINKEKRQWDIQERSVQQGEPGDFFGELEQGDGGAERFFDTMRGYYQEMLEDSAMTAEIERDFRNRSAKKDTSWPQIEALILADPGKHTRAELAKQVGLKSSTVNNYLLTRGTKELRAMVKREDAAAREKSARQEKAIIEMLAQGMMQKDIAERLDTTSAAVSWRVRQMRRRGVELPDSKGIRNRELDRLLMETDIQHFQIAEQLGIKAKQVSVRAKSLRDSGLKPKARKLGRQPKQ